MSDYGVRINRALNYAQEKLPGYVGLDEVAQIAAFSPYHFHRIFILVVGDSFANFMRKRRLEWAAMALLNTQSRILDISLDAGFETQETFTRAFKNYFEITPAKFRSRVKNPEEVFIGVKSNFEIHVGELMKPQMIERDSFEVVGIVKDYDTPDFSGALAQWKTFHARSSETNTLNSNRSYGLAMIPISTRKENNCTDAFRYLTAYEVPAEESICWIGKKPGAGLQSEFF